MTALVAFVVSLAICVTAVSVPAARRIFSRSSDGPRWREDAVPLAGGVAMGLGFASALVVFGGDVPGVGWIVGASLVGLGVGLVDDLRALSPVAKLGGQVATGITLAGGVRPDLPGGDIVGALATTVLTVVVINAVNVFDNIDAAAGAVSLVAVAAVWIWWETGSGPTEIPASLTGAIAGFLVLNLPPARVFMGDAGSHFLGASLTALVVLDGGRVGAVGDPSPLLVVAVPLVLLAVPIYDAVFVAVERYRHHRPVSVGGLDHTSHRLARLGLGTAAVVAVLALAAAASAGVASLAAVDGPWFALGTGVLAVAAVTVWWRLAQVEP